MSGKIYVTRNNNKCYRWTGSTYIEISSTLELQNIQAPDSRADISAGAGNFWGGLSVGATQTNGKNHYYGGDGDGYYYQVFWTGSQWKIAMSYSGDGNDYAESVSTSNTTYPWQATGWTNNGSVSRVGTYDAALAPAPLGIDAYSGIGTKAAREDHVHPLPTPAAIGAATAAQGTKADSALQPAALTPYRTSAAQDTIDAGKATAAQGTKADSAL
ncbi:MAG: hypothetical protein EBY32_20320, partial [Proteobacteria bacterium]|nr:hypothetical protein [Pseudomonadota bacterium]